MKSRREFLQISAAGSVGMALLGSFSACTTAPADRKSYGVGIQLYTIRDAMSADTPGSLKKVSDLGYKNLELAGYSNGKFYGYTPAEFKKMVNDLDMDIISSHTQVEAAGITLENAKLMADAHAELGVKYCIQPWVNDEDRQVETYKKMIAEWNKVGAIMKERGIQFGYHNHNFEFDTLDGLVPYYDLFMPELDADLVTMELDLFWASKAGQDPVEMFNKYPGRFQLLHMKDMRTNEDPFYNVYKEDVCSVGEGVIDFKRILAAKETAGTKYLFVEDDNQGNGKPFEGIESSIVNLTTKILS
ncbi:sugar phosphate isomerase/epimerase family protein [Sunxiuqinia elliptica]|uniref:Sugar phosphate isomerase/epimerase n=1 Tax=Sunxiuqinia elliptica TaxID=655355 RepID=A0A4V3BZ91_9BACT|nr:sugar phosphate isomerase/epimerase [Sunxiuqinia elliptica]TDO05519.1 sugar phosphate isomerase/epimerase [Sunxiuqinia elliptica]TDO65065.1 sugar phosphate isomerase/epimerase [Sunxiuqinia elliptica]